MVDTDRELFWTLLEVEHPKAEAFCRKLEGSLADGDDLYQDALLTAMRKFSRLRDKTAFKPWLYRIIINTFTSHRRGAWWKRRVQLTTEIMETLASDDPSHEYAAKRWIEIAMRPLSPDDRALVTLYELDGWSIAELARLRGKPEGTIKSCLSRARTKMRQEVARYLPKSKTKIEKEKTRYALPQSET
jgi:RNA polymerase sigma-70 factor, ECF subfamily